MSACPGCGLELPLREAPQHPYIGASPACWQLYTQLLAEDYGRFNMPPEHKFMVDAYAAQHPGGDERRSRQSVAVHLIRLCLMLERGREARYANKMMSRATNGTIDFPRLDQPTPIGTLTVADMVGAETLDEHAALLRRWAEDVWRAYSAHHDQVRLWCDHVERQLPESAAELGAALGGALDEG